ncbi:MAG TPA: YdcF family protein [Longimicrobium sp.]|nr:YdcF family protein [Longimicrobium sp.]
MRLFLLLVAGWALLLAAIAFYGRRDEARQADAIVVLGAAQYNGHPSPVLEARLDHAIDLYRRGIAKTVIMTGGQAPGDTVSEAVVSRRYAVKAGVPRGAILVETTGMTTRESMAAVGRLMHDRRMGTAVLVSDPFHMLRLKLLAWQVDVKGLTSPTHTSPISRNPGQERKFLLRESIGLPLVLLGLA